MHEIFLKYLDRHISSPVGDEEFELIKKAFIQKVEEEADPNEGPDIGDILFRQ